MEAVNAVLAAVEKAVMLWEKAVMWWALRLWYGTELKIDGLFGSLWFFKRHRWSLCE